MNQTQKIKEIVAKIDIEKIATYSQNSKTLRQIIRYSKRLLDSNDDQEVFKLAVELAYDLDTICEPTRTNYVKNEAEKKYWLGISRELFENTVGLKI